MTGLVQAVADRVIGAVEEVSADRILVRLDPDAPEATALNTGAPAGFPRINGYVVIPNEGGSTACIISSVRIERLPFPKRKGMQQDFGLVDLPFPSRVMSLTPIGTLRARPLGDALSFRVQRGVDVFPSVGDPVLLPGADQLRAIVEGEDDSAQRIAVGHCPTAGRAPVHVDPDKLFGRHLAVLGNTGAGKSCSVAGLVRWSLDAARTARIAAKRSGKPNARFIVLDPNGEYARAFGDFNVRLFRVDAETGAEALRVPAWLWNGAEWAAFTGAAPGAQRPVLFEALRRLRSGLGAPDKVETEVRGRIRRYRNQLGAALLRRRPKGLLPAARQELLDPSKAWWGGRRGRLADRPRYSISVSLGVVPRWYSRVVEVPVRIEVAAGFVAPGASEPPRLQPSWPPGGFGPAHG